MAYLPTYLPACLPAGRLAGRTRAWGVQRTLQMSRMHVRIDGGLMCA